MTDQLEFLAVQQVLEVAARSGKEVVDAHDVGAFRKQTFGKMGAEEAGSAGDQYARFKMHLQMAPVTKNLETL
jgi:hypothetical protein